MMGSFMENKYYEKKNIYIYSALHKYYTYTFPK